jgi:hypothetical protein
MATLQQRTVFMSIRNPSRTLTRLVVEEDGLEAVEWILVLGAAVVPIMLLAYEVMKWVAIYYSYISWTISLPFP